LVFGSPILGIPALGVVGAGIANSITSVLRLLVVVFAAARMSPTAGRWSRWREAFSFDDLARIVRIGLPIGMQMALEIGVFTLAAFAMGQLGARQLAAHQLTLQASSVTFNFMVGMASGCAVLVGQRIGAEDRIGARRAGVVALRTSLLVMAGTGALFLFAGESLAALLTTDVEVIGAAVVLFQIAAAFQLSDGLQAVASGALRGAGDTRATFIIHAVSHWGVGAPMVLCAVAFGAGAAGVWWGLTAGLTVAAVLLVWRFFHAARGFVHL
jgi:MATE family multidrug resistance protein